MNPTQPTATTNNGQRTTDNIVCPHRIIQGEQPVCAVVAKLIDRPLNECHTNDSACRFCLACGIAPQAPNTVTASMSISAARRTGDRQVVADISRRMRPHLRQAPATPKATPENTPCIHRGRELRQVECKPCQANGGQLSVPVFRCPIHAECTINNTGIHPRIQGCATCADRKE